MAPPRKCNCNTPGCMTCYRREWGRAAYRAKAYGTFNPKGDLQQVRAHIATLRESGISAEALAESLGASKSNMKRITAGHTKHITKELADRILAAQPRPKSYPGWAVQRRLRALAAIGWPGRVLAERLNVDLRNFQDWTGHAKAPRWVHRATFDKVDALYRELCMTPGPSDMARRIARGKGWLPPLAWSDIDDPDEQPDRGSNDTSTVDPIVVERILAGDYQLEANRAEREAVIDRWIADGRSATSLRTATGWNVDRILRERRDAA